MSASIASRQNTYPDLRAKTWSSVSCTLLSSTEVDFGGRTEGRGLCEIVYVSLVQEMLSYCVQSQMRRYRGDIKPEKRMHVASLETLKPRKSEKMRDTTNAWVPIQ